MRPVRHRHRQNRERASPLVRLASREVKSRRVIRSTLETRRNARVIFNNTDGDEKCGARPSRGRTPDRSGIATPPQINISAGTTTSLSLSLSPPSLSPPNRFIEYAYRASAIRLSSRLAKFHDSATRRILMTRQILSLVAFQRDHSIFSRRDDCAYEKVRLAGGRIVREMPAAAYARNCQVSRGIHQARFNERGISMISSSRLSRFVLKILTCLPRRERDVGQTREIIVVPRRNSEILPARRVLPVTRTERESI